MIEVIVPTRNNLAQLRDCLESLSTQTARAAAVHVCVDGSTDGSLEYLAHQPFELPIKVHTHSGNRHRGRAATRNLAIRSLERESVLFLDSDMVLRSTGIAKHLDVLAAGHVASVGSVVYTNSSENAWSRYLSSRGRNRWPNGAVLPYRQFATANAALSTSVFVASGGFDERFEQYGGEDLEFAYRLAMKQGLQLINNRDAVAETIERKTVREALAQLETYGATNLRAIERLHPEIPRGFLTDKVGSRRLRDRALLALLNPATDAFVVAALTVAPFALARQLLNYQVIRAVHRGYSSTRVRA